MFINKGFGGNRKTDIDEKLADGRKRLPPGQYLTSDFPVLSLGPTPIVENENWKLKISGLADRKEYTWNDLIKLPSENITEDIHCVTKWSKYDTNWKGVWLDYFIEDANVRELATHLIAYGADTYSTNLTLDEIVNKKCLIAYQYADEDIEEEHGGPVRLVIPHLYFWKSAKWLNELQFIDRDEPGFWEVRGYHNHGDPWEEERYSDF